MIEVKNTASLESLGSTEPEIFHSICVCAARYLSGVTRPKEELATEEQQRHAMEQADAVYKYLHIKEQQRGWE